VNPFFFKKGVGQYFLQFTDGHTFLLSLLTRIADSYIVGASLAYIPTNIRRIFWMPYMADDINDNL